MSMNLWNYNHWHKRLDLLNQVLMEYQPDIIGLQELRIRTRYFVPDLMPYDDPLLMHTFQINDLLTLCDYFQSGEYQWYRFVNPTSTAC